MPFIQTEITKDFIKAVKTLVDSRQYGRLKDIAGRLEYNYSALNQIMNGGRNVPKYVYDKFQEVYTNIQSNVEENEVQYATLNRTSLERSIENLTENELRTTAVIERLVSILEFNLMGGKKDHHVFADPGLNQGGEGFAKPSGKSKKS